MRHPTVSSRIVDVLVLNPGITYSRLLSLLDTRNRGKVGLVLHLLQQENIVTRTEAGRYSLSKSSERALAA